MEFPMTSVTEQTIVDQFKYWRSAPLPEALADKSRTYVIIGCGTSFNLALSLAASFCEQGYKALAVPGGEWLGRSQNYVPQAEDVTLIALSRSGETTETVRATSVSREAGIHVIGITCEKGSSLARAASELVFAPTDPAEGIVMTTSASLMLMLGLALCGIRADEASFLAAEAMLKAVESIGDRLPTARRHFVFLGGGQLYGIALEGGLKLQEMSLSFTQGFHPLEYRHGPISLVDEGTMVIMLHHPATAGDEAHLVKELQAKGAFVLSLDGKADEALSCDAPANLRSLVYLPALQWFGEAIARARGIDTTAPRHLTKVVMLQH
jgi:glucosamine--fructose-6-phosphate aminotransferase (isomerizing)